MSAFHTPICRDVLGKEAVFSWWHGKGGLLDYTNPDAVDWWHHQMDKVIQSVILCKVFIGK